MTQKQRMVEEDKGFQGTADDLYSEPKEIGIGQKIICIQSELKAPKNQYNNFGKYNYRSQEDILEGLKPLLKKYDVLLTISDDIVMVSDRVYVMATVTATSINGQVSNKAYAREPENKKGMDESQITGTASSYARKYALNGMFLIDDTKDADTDEHKNQVENAPAKKPPVKKESDDKPWLNATAKDGSLTKNGEYTAQRLYNEETTWEVVLQSVKVSKKDTDAVNARVNDLLSQE